MKHKNDKIAPLLLFSLVPISQLIAYFSIAKSEAALAVIKSIQDGLSFSNTQMTILEFIMISIYSVILFTIMFLINSVVLNVSEDRDLTAFFLSLILSIGTSNLFKIIDSDYLHTPFSTLIPAIIHLIVVTLSYYSFAKDKKGTALVALVSLLINVVPAIIIHINA